MFAIPIAIFSLPVMSTGRTVVVTLVSVSASASASGCFGLKFIKDPYLHNPLMD